jgi:hypothetical protein
MIENLFKIWTKLRDHTLEIRNPMSKFKSYKNVGTKYDFFFPLIYMDKTKIMTLLIVKFYVIHTFIQYFVCSCVIMFSNVMLYNL